ncbi:NAD-dependent dihydropyrimidine dehydrogenase sunbunit PreT [Raoultella planticola]|uniref:NAD-dependent dihydropyrimidine dehydrogenase sunbunit PreT n=1 Tax=Raoultella planticola TaxID=575 RepID=A0A485CP90_RAOPL|nr:NAD-dependent dihydropyrimidine dehydrogenase sunbunit PreT [Raoultella planticola]
MKKIALEKGWEEYQQRWHKPAGSGTRHPVAVIGAGPAGLAAGYFLARAGHPVTLFEREANAGGVVRNIIPQFRIPAELVEHDIDFVIRHGVNLVYGCDPHLSVEKLQQEGFHYVLVGTGTDKNSGVPLGGDNPNVRKSLQFLREYNRGDNLMLGEACGYYWRGKYRNGLRPRGPARPRSGEGHDRLSPFTAGDACLA